MIRRFAFIPAALVAICAFTAAPASAQNPPSERDLKVYAGLHLAAANGDVAEIEKLAAAGEKIDIQDANSRTPLIVAAYRKQYPAVQALLRLGANPNAHDIDRFDILTIAAVNDDMELVKMALAGGASAKNVTGTYDGTALISAAHLGHPEIVQALIAAGAPLDHVNRLGWTALIQAIVLGNGSKQHVECVEALVKAGADVDIKDRHGTTALEHARQRGYQDMIPILEAASGRKT